MPSWTWKEQEVIWLHPDWTAAELTELLPRHSEKAIAAKRTRIGRYNASGIGMCEKCGERPVWVESAKAARYKLCKGCMLEEEERRIKDERRHAAVRQARHRARKRIKREGR